MLKSTIIPHWQSRGSTKITGGVASLPLISWLLTAAETPTNFNSAATILAQLSIGRLSPSQLMTMLLNVILIYFNLTILPSLSPLQDALEMG
jgi:hypothetical protein